MQVKQESIQHLAAEMPDISPKGSGDQNRVKREVNIGITYTQRSANVATVCVKQASATLKG